MLLHHRRHGDPGAVAVHGVSGCGAAYDGLGERVGLLAVDLRGHGRSGAEPPWSLDAHVDDLLATADAAGLSRCAWIGFSFGALVVAGLAARAPERVERLALLDPAIALPPELVLAHAEEDRNDRVFPDADAAIEDRLAAGTLFSTPRATLEAYAAEHLEPVDGGVTWRFNRSAATVAWSEMAGPPPPVAPVPTLLVLGARSWVDQEPTRARLRAALGPALVEVGVPGGHSVLWDDPAPTADAIVRFLG